MDNVARPKSPQARQSCDGEGRKWRSHERRASGRRACEKIASKRPVLTRRRPGRRCADHATVMRCRRVPQQAARKTHHQLREPLTFERLHEPLLFHWRNGSRDVKEDRPDVPGVCEKAASIRNSTSKTLSMRDLPCKSTRAPVGLLRPLTRSSGTWRRCSAQCVASSWGVPAPLLSEQANLRHK